MFASHLFELGRKAGVIASVVLIFAGCKDKKPGAENTAQAPTAPAVAGASATPPAEAKGKSPGEADKGLPVPISVKQATVMVRVIFGALEPQDFIGAVLQTDAQLDSSSVRRFIALVPGYTEDQLRNASCRFRVFVTTNPRFASDASSYPAALIAYDPKLEMGVFAFTPGLPGQTSGFEQGQIDAASEGRLITAKLEPRAAENPAATEAAPSAKLLELKARKFPLARIGNGNLEISGFEVSSGASALALDSANKLIGFIRLAKEGPARLVQASPEIAATKLPTLTKSGRVPSNQAGSASGADIVEDGTVSVPAEFPLEGTARDIHEIAGGKELLIEFDGAPFWKRFSVTKKAWLPLPEANLSESDLTGNLTHLFVLDRSKGRVTSYGLSDLAKAKEMTLPAEASPYRAIRAGCNNASAPVHVISDRGLVALDSATLQRRNAGLVDKTERWLNRSENGKIRAVGDGLTLVANKGANSAEPVVLSYVNDWTGWIRDFYTNGPREGQLAVSSAYGIQDGTLHSCLNPEAAWLPVEPSNGVKTYQVHQMLIPNAPLVMRLSKARLRSGATATRIELRGFQQERRFGSLVISSAIAMPSYVRTERPMVTFEVESRRFGLVSEDKKTLSIHEVPAEREAGEPILLNWPDCIARRGGEVRFSPRLSGEAKIEAELSGTQTLTPVQVSGSEIAFKIPENEPRQHFLLNLKCTSKSGSVANYRIPLHLIDVPPAAAAALPPSADADQKASKHFGAMLGPQVRRQSLPSEFYQSPEKVIDVHGPISGALVVRTENEKIDFVSMSPFRKVGAMSAPKAAVYYSGGGALFEYDPGTRALTRVEVPTGRRAQSTVFPKNMELAAIALGEGPRDPLTLFIERRKLLDSERYIGPWGDYTFSAWESDRGMLVLDSTTLRQGPWAQPKGSHPFTHSSDGLPERIVGSKNGTILAIKGNLLIITPQYSPIVTRTGVDPFGPYRGTAMGSITGFFTGNSEGYVFKNGVAEGNVPWGTRISKCGRYYFKWVDAGWLNPIAEVWSLEDRKPLFRIESVAALDRGMKETTNAQLRFLDDDSRVLAIGKDGKFMQLIGLNVAEAHRTVSPNSMHVISQPNPCVLEGGIFSYKVQVNNPGQIAQVKLREPIAGAAMTPDGTLQYRAPVKVDAATRVDFPIEILTKDGATQMHQVPIFVIPWQRAATGAQRPPVSI